MRQLTIVLLIATFVVAPLAALAANSANPEAVYRKGRAALVEVMKIGGGPEDSEDEAPFYRPMNPCIGRDGTIYVLDYQTTEVSAFSPAGEFLFKFAREGEGPGELRYPMYIAVDGRGRVVIDESGNRRFSIFTPRGKFIKTVPYTSDEAGKFQYLPDGRIVADIGRQYMANAGVFGTVWSIMVLDSTYQPVAALDSLKSEMLVVNSSKGTQAGTPPFPNSLVWCTGPDGRIHFGKAGEYRITVVDSALKPIRRLARDVPRVKISGEDRKRYTRQMPPELVAAAKFPDAKPPIDGLYCDSAGYLLVDRAVAFGAKAAVMDIYRPDGSFLGEFSVDGMQSRPVFDKDTILMRVTSKEEMPAIIRYRLE